MNSDEQIVKQYLLNSGYSDVAYEPDGNVPPDFLVDGSIAVEVRRLNQHYFGGEFPEGLEIEAIPLWRQLGALAVGLGPPIDDQSWYLYFRFERPVERFKTLLPKIRAALEVFKASATKTKGLVFEQDGFEIEVVRSPTLHPSLFTLGGCTDRDSGGWLIHEMHQNIVHCVSEKTLKVSQKRQKYPVWWLALVDYIGFGLDDSDKAALREHVSLHCGWGRIIVIDPRDARTSFDL